MAAGTFTIQEIKRIGATRTQANIGETFEWTSDRTPNDPSLGGARAAPLRPWTFGTALRTVRTDYPGAKTPSEQVLGPNHKPFSLTGRFDDRYNFPGYAVQEMRRFEAMVRRGNLVRIGFQNQAFEALITDLSFDYHREWYIGYTITVSTHDRPDDFTIEDRSPSTARSVQGAFDEMDFVVQALATVQTEAPASYLEGSINADAQADTDALLVAQDSLANTVDERELRIGPETIGPFKRIATQFRTVGNLAFSLSNNLIALRSDVSMGVRTALSVLNFEDWSRSMRFNARIILGSSQVASRDIEERDEAEAIALYRPTAGESLYAISRRFYGTPNAWRLIAERNALQTTNLDGTELLIIPERGEG